MNWSLPRFLGSQISLGLRIDNGLGHVEDCRITDCSRGCVHSQQARLLRSQSVYEFKIGGILEVLGKPREWHIQFTKTYNKSSPLDETVVIFTCYRKLHIGK